MRIVPDALEVVSFNADNKSSIVYGEYTCFINYYYCDSEYFGSCGSRINYLVSILTSPFQWKYFTGSLSTWNEGRNLIPIYKLTI
jgi:hypothetical protein